MDPSTRLKLLSRLAASRTPEAQSALEREFAAAALILESDSDYDRLAEALAVVEAVGFRFSARTVSVVGSFSRTIEQRTLTFSDADSLVAQLTSRYRNAEALLLKAI